MAERWERTLDTWRRAELIDDATAGRIRAFESARKSRWGAPWPALIALIFGALSLGAGALLLVAAHWDALSPFGRFALVLLMVGGLHGTGAAAHRLPLFGRAMHAAGTASLGGGIYLAAQIFHLHEHWSSGVGLWALGALLGWGLLRHTAQALLAALLVPAWLVSERIAQSADRNADLAAAQGLVLLSIVYLFSQVPHQANDSSPSGAHAGATVTRCGLSLLGGLAVFPCTFYLFAALGAWHGTGTASIHVETMDFVAYALAFALPSGLAVVLRRRDAVRFSGALAWVGVLSIFDLAHSDQLLLALLWSFVAALGLALWGSFDRSRPLVLLGLLGALIAQTAVLIWASDRDAVFLYGLCALNAAIVVAGGVRFANRDAINTGVAAFGLTVAFFYFSAVLDKLGRSLSLIGLGVLFLGGGFVLERARRRLLETLPKEQP